MSMIKVAVIEDRREIRDGLAALINGTEGYCCTAAFRSMEFALAGIGASLPDIVLVDIGLPGMSGIEGIRLLKERHRRSSSSCSAFTTMTSGFSRHCAPVRAGIS